MEQLQHIERADSMMEAEKRITAAGQKGERNESGIARRGKVPLKISAVGPGDGAASFGHRDADNSVVHTGCAIKRRALHHSTWPGTGFGDASSLDTEAATHVRSKILDIDWALHCQAANWYRTKTGRQGSLLRNAGQFLR